MIWDEINLNELSDDEIKGLIAKCTAIDKKRQNEKNKKLIEKLEQAFYDVRQANIGIYINYGDLDEINLTTDFSCDDFYFEY